MLRANKHGQLNRGLFSRLDDQAGSLIPAVALAVCTAVFLLIVQTTLISIGPAPEVSAASINYYKLPLAAVVMIFYFYVSLEYLELNKFAVLFLCLWIVPLLLSIFLAVAFEFEEFVLYIASVSPFALIVISVQGLTAEFLYDEDFELLSNAYWIGTLSIAALTAFLGYQLKILKDRTRKKIASAQR